MKSHLCLLLLIALCNVAFAEDDIQDEHVAVLTDDNFDDLVTNSSSWLLEFYAPWCGHCKKLAPIYEETARDLSGVLNLGKIDCTTNKKLAQRFQIKSYPTIKFWRDGELRAYRLARNKAAFMEFAKSVTGPAVTSVDSSSLDSLLHAHGVVFLLLGDSAPAMKVFNQVARVYQGVLKFVKTSDVRLATQYNLQPAANHAYVVAIRADDDPAIYNLQSPYSIDGLKSFVEKSRFQLVTELGAANFEDVTSTGKLTLIAVVDRQKPNTNSFLSDVRFVAKQFNHQFMFGALDGVTWSDYVAKFDISSSQLPTVFLLDAPNEVYWLLPAELAQEPLDAASIVKFLEMYNKNEVSARGNTPWSVGYYFKAANKWLEGLTETQLLIGTAILIAIFGVMMILVCCFAGPTDEEYQIAKQRAELKQKLKAAGKPADDAHAKND